MTEAELQHEVISLCEKYGLLVFHSTDSRRDIGTGFPDLVICGRRPHLHPDRVVLPPSGGR